MTTTVPTVQTRQPYLDVLRTGAMYLVILLHCMTPYLSDGQYYGTRSWPVLLVLNSFVRTGVPLFFMISGYLALSAPAPESMGAYYRKRFQRLLPPFLFWDVVYFLLACHDSGQAPALGQFLQELVHEGSKFHLWFVYYILALYLLTPFLQKITSQCSRGQLWGLLILTLLPTTLLPAVNILLSVYIAPLPVLLNGYLGFYLLGYLLGTLTPSRRILLAGGLCGMAGLLIGVYGNHFFSSPELIELRFNAGLQLNHFLLAGCLFLSVRCLPPSLFQKGLFALCGTLSRISYGVYLVHALVLEQLVYGPGISALTMRPLIELLIHFCVVALVTTATCLLLSKIPLLRRLVT